MPEKTAKGHDLTRGERMQIMLTGEELVALDDFRYSRRMPSRASAVRELLRRGLAAEGFDLANAGLRSHEYGVLEGNSGNGNGHSSASNGNGGARKR